MPIYAQKAREKYEIDRNREAFVQAVWDGIVKHTRGSKIALRATKAFVELAEQDSDWVEGKKILEKIGMEHYKFNQSYGLWPWLDRKNGADIVVERGHWPNTTYKTKLEFYEIMKRVVLKSVSS